MICLNYSQIMLLGLIWGTAGYAIGVVILLAADRIVDFTVDRINWKWRMKG
jgi:hypothetical protein